MKRFDYTATMNFFIMHGIIFLQTKVISKESHNHKGKINHFGTTFTLVCLIYNSFFIKL